MLGKKEASHLRGALALPDVELSESFRHDCSRPSSVNLSEMLSGVQNMFVTPKSPRTTL